MYFGQKRGVCVIIKAKLIIVFSLMIIIPIVIINVVSANIIKDNCTEVYVNSVERSMKNQADDINFYCETIISNAKHFTIQNHVRDYVKEAEQHNFENLDENENYAYVMEQLKLYADGDRSVIKAMVIENSGMVIASTAEEKIGRRLSNYKELFSLALENNGFSDIFIDSNTESPAFSITKSIYSEKNERIGVLYVVYDTMNIQSYINSMKLDKYTNAAVMDSGGNVLEYPYKSLKPYGNNTNYSPYSNELAAILSGANHENYINVMVEKIVERKQKLYYTTEISNSGWMLISVTDKFSWDDTISALCNILHWLSAIICVLCIVLVCIFAIWFTKPVMEILRVFREKKNGNVNSRFDIRTKDEFSTIGHAFNSMFDNIFESEQRYRTIVEMTNNIIFEVNYKKGTVFTSKNFNKKFSLRPKDDSLTESFLYKLRVHKDDRERYAADLERILNSANFIQGEYRVKSIYGDFIWIMIKATKFFDRNENPTKIVGVIVDIDREKKSEMHLLYKASYDNLTQLYNRETFLKSLAEELEISMVKKSLDAVMFIDLDDFKFFNDQYGHACGDEVLKFVADTIKEISFERGFAGRFGGDEFVVCFTNLTLYGDSGKIAQEIIDVLGKGFVSESTGMKLSIKCSIGIAFLRESGKTTEEIIAAADEAMYNIKKHGKSAYAYAKSVSKSDAVYQSNTSKITSSRLCRRMVKEKRYV